MLNIIEHELGLSEHVQVLRCNSIHYHTGFTGISTYYSDRKLIARNYIEPCSHTSWSPSTINLTFPTSSSKDPTSPHKETIERTEVSNLAYQHNLHAIYKKLYLRLHQKQAGSWICIVQAKEMLQYLRCTRESREMSQLFIEGSEKSTGWLPPQTPGEVLET